MQSEAIDLAIEKYVNERMEQGRKRASEHFLAYVYAKHRGDDVREFMKKVCGLTRYYIDFLRVMENPFKGPEIAWLGTMILIGIFSCYLIALEEERLLGMLVLSGTLVHFCSLIALMAKKWSDTGVMIAIYREIAEIAEREAAGTA